MEPSFWQQLRHGVTVRRRLSVAMDGGRRPKKSLKQPKFSRINLLNVLNLNIELAFQKKLLKALDLGF